MFVFFFFVFLSSYSEIELSKSFCEANPINHNPKRNYGINYKSKPATRPVPVGHIIKSNRL